MRLPGNGWMLCLVSLMTACACSIFLMAADDDPDEGRERAVIERFQSVLEKNPRRGTALDRIYGHHVERGSLDTLVASYRDRASKAKGADSASSYMIMGLLESLRGNDASAAEAFGNAERLDTGNYLAPYYLGQALILVGQPDKAAEAFERSIARKPAQIDQLDIYQALGRVYQQGQQNDKALDVWNRLQKQFPNDTRVQEQIASTLLEEGEFAAALPRFESLIKLTKDKYRQSLYQIEVAELKMRLNKREEALRDFEKLLGQLNPDNWLFREVRRRIEEIFLRTDDQVGLIAYYEAWLKKSPEDLEAVSRLARLLSGLGRTAESQEWLEKALKSAPSRKELRHALITQLLYEQKFAAAITQYELLDKYEPNNPDTLREWGRLILKDTARDEEQRKKDAGAIWKRLLTLKPKDALTASRTGELFRQAGMADDALALYRKAIELAPDAAEYKEYLGEYYHALQRKDEALATWRQIAEGKSRTAANVARLAEVLAGFGYLSEAIETNTDACSLDPKDINLQIKQVDLLSQAERHEDALQQLDIVKKLAANDEEQEAWLVRELKELQALKQLGEQIAEARNSLAGQTENNVNSDDKGKLALAARWYWLARACEAERLMKEAGEAINLAAELQPQSIPILTASARISETNSNLLAAVEINNRLASIDRRYRTEYLKKVAQLEVTLGRRDKALQAGRDVIASAPGNPDLYEFFSRLCFQLGENDEGLQALRRSVRVNPTELKSLQLLASALSDLFRTDEAVELYWRAFEKAGHLDDRLAVVPRLTELYLQTNQLDRLLERLERLRREPNQQREMTICLAQAYQSAGDDGNARLELEKLLTEETRDTQLLGQLVKLSESDADYEMAVRYQQQINKIAPAREGTLRLAQLLFKQGEDEQATSLMTGLLMEEKDPEQILKSIDALITSRRTEQAIQLLSRLVREQPRNWELLYRYGLALAEKSPEEAEKQFEAILALRQKDDELGLYAKTAARKLAAMSPWQRATSGLDEDHSLMGRSQKSWSIRQAVDLNEDAFAQQQQQQQPLWTPGDYGDARMAAIAWQIALAGKKGKSEDYLAQRKEAYAQSTEYRDLVDWYYFSLMQNDDEAQYEILKALSMRPDMEHEAGILFLYALRQRKPLDDEAESGDVSDPAMMPNPGDDLQEENLPPLSDEELDHVIKLADRLGGDDPASRYGMEGGILDIVISELKRAGRTEEANERFARAVASATTPIAISQVMNGIIADGDDEKAMELFERLASMAREKPQATTQNNLGVFDMEGYVLSNESLGGLLGQLMALRTSKNKEDDADEIMEGVPELWERFLLVLENAPPAPPALALQTRNQRMAAVQEQFNFNVWNLSNAQVTETIDFPSPSDAFESASIQLLLQMFVLYREAEQTDTLIKWFAERTKDPATPENQRVTWQFGLGCLQWWNQDADEALVTLREAVSKIPDSTETKFLLANLYEKRREFSRALELVDEATASDQASLQRREIAALRLAIHAGKVERARTAATRLFGLRLDSNLQLALARQMHQLGMHRQAEAVLARASRQAGNKTDVLVSLMEQYSSTNPEVAVQIAYQLMRRSKPASPNSGHRHGPWGMGSNDNSGIRAQALQVLNRSGKLPKMIARTEAQLKKAPKSQRLLETLLEYHSAAGDEKQIEELNQRLGELRINDPRFRLQIALKLLESGKTEDAIEHLKVVAQKEPNLFMNSFWQIENALENRGHEEEFYSLMETIDLKAFRSNTHYITNAINRLSHQEKTRTKAFELFKRAWKEVPESRNDLLSSMNGDEFWSLPNIYQYVREGVVPTAAVVSNNRWHGFGHVFSVEDKGIVTTVTTRLLDLAKRQDKLDELATELSDTVTRIPNWSGGKVLLAMISLRQGRIDEGKAEFEAMLSVFAKPRNNDSNFIGNVQREIGQELMRHDSCAELAVKYFEGAIANGEDNGGDFDFSVSKPLVELLKKLGRRNDARMVLLKHEMTQEDDSYDRHYRVYQQVENAVTVGRELQEIGCFGDAIRLFHGAMNRVDDLRDSPWGAGQVEEFKHQLESGIATATAQLKSESIVELLTPLPKPVADPRRNQIFSQGIMWHRPRTRPDKKEPAPPEQPNRLDLILQVTTPDLSHTRMSAALVSLISEISSLPALRDEASAVLQKRRETAPDDFGVSILQAELKLKSTEPEDRKAVLVELLAQIERTPLEVRPDNKHEPIALMQVPLWIIARECWPDESLRELAEQVAQRALAAAKLLSDDKYTMAILREWGQIAADAGDKDKAVKLWTSLLDEVLPKPNAKPKKPAPQDMTFGGGISFSVAAPAAPAGFAVPVPATGIAFAPAFPGSGEMPAAPGGVLTIQQFERAAQLAKLAAENRMIELSLLAVTRSLRNGPPIDGNQQTDPGNPFGTPASNNDSRVAQVVQSQMAELERTWNRQGVSADEIYNVLRSVVLTEARPLEVLSYFVPLSQSPKQEPQSVGALLALAAIRAKKVDELKEAISTRLEQPLGEFAARILLTQLSIATQDVDDVKSQLSDIMDRLKQDSLQYTGELACHVAIPAMANPETSPLAVQLMAQIVDHLHKSIQTQGQRGGQHEPVTSLTFRLARHYFRNGRVEDARKLLDSWISLQTPLWSNHGGDYSVYQRKMAFLRVAAELARHGLRTESMVMFGRYADSVTTRDYRSDTGKDGAVLLNGLGGLDVKERYRLLKEWSLPTPERRSVRIFAPFVPGDRLPESMDALRDVGLRGTPTGQLTSTLQMLIDAAREAGELVQLQQELEPLAESKIENAEVTFRLIQFANGQGEKGLDFLKRRVETKEPQTDRAARPIKLTDHSLDLFLARAALLDQNPDVRAQGRRLAELSIGGHYSDQRDEMTVPIILEALNAERIGPTLAEALNSRSPESGLKFWNNAASLASLDKSLVPWWNAHEQMISHHGGALDSLYFAYPLTGEFDLEFESSADVRGRANGGYGGLIFAAQDSNDAIEIFPVGREQDAIFLPSVSLAYQAWNRLRLSVRGESVTLTVNGHPAYTTRSVLPNSPFAILQSRGPGEAVFRNPRITGTPVIPREVSLVNGNCLLGWVCDIYKESQPRFLPPNEYHHQQEARRHHPANEPVAMDWSAEKGELQGRLAGASLTTADPQPSSLYYGRPLRSGESVHYEFWYEPGEDGCDVHPTLDRLVFLMNPNGIQMTWMTDDETQLSLNGVTEKECRRGPARLPLKEGDWNSVDIALDAAVVSLRLNGTHVYERPLEQNNSRQFGFFHDKSRTSVRVRHITLTGDWPKELGPDVLEHLLDPSAPRSAEQQKSLSNLFDDRFAAMNVGDVLRYAAVLTAKQRWDYLSEYVLPGPNHGNFRMYATFTPMDVATSPKANPASVQGDSPSRQRMGGELISPALELITVAGELGRLDELTDVIRKLGDPTSVNERSRKAMLGLIALARGNAEETRTHLNELIPLLKDGMTDKGKKQEWMSEFVLAWKALSVPELRPVAKDVADLVDQPMPKTGEFATPMFLARQRLACLLDGMDPLPLAPAMSPKGQWSQVTIPDNQDRSLGVMPAWKFDGQYVQHVGGYGDDLLFFQSPLQGRFAVEYTVSAFNSRNVSLTYNDSAVGPQPSLDKFLISNSTSNASVFVIDPKLKPFGDWYVGRMEVEPGKITYFVNGQKCHTVDLPSPPDPWLAFRTFGQSTAAIRRVQIIGNPEIPQEIKFNPQKDVLRGWTSDLYEIESETPIWSSSGGEIIGRRIPHIQGRHQESLVRYQRPMLEDGEFVYDFFYVPGQTLVHPALGQTAFLLDPDGVKLHMLTGDQYERTGLLPDNSHVEPNGKSQPLPLNAKQWNNMKLAVQGQTLTLTLNGTLIYKGLIEPTNQREFGFFRYAGDTDVRLKGIVYRGNWPRKLPSLKDQELAGDEAALMTFKEEELSAKWSWNFQKERPSGWELEGNDERGTRVAEKGGSSIQLSSDSKRPAGLLGFSNAKIDFGGDFEVTLSYRDFKSSTKTEGWDAPRVELKLSVGEKLNGSLNTHLLAMTHRRKSDDSLQVTSLLARRGDQMDFEWLSSDEPSQSSAGRFRIVRRGGLAYYLHAEGDSADWKLLDVRHVPKSDIKEVVVGLQTGVESTEGSVVLTDLTIRAKHLKEGE